MTCPKPLWVLVWCVGGETWEEGPAPHSLPRLPRQEWGWERPSWEPWRMGPALWPPGQSLLLLCLLPGTPSRSTPVLTLRVSAEGSTSSRKTPLTLPPDITRQLGGPVALCSCHSHCGPHLVLPNRLSSPAQPGGSPHVELCPSSPAPLQYGMELPSVSACRKSQKDLRVARGVGGILHTEDGQHPILGTASERQTPAPARQSPGRRGMF